MRRGTTISDLILLSFNSRTPGGVRHRRRPHGETGAKFQFTHPGRGATGYHIHTQQQCRRFNSRTPGGVRPSLQAYAVRGNVVSIHAPREGCDRSAEVRIASCLRFNSRTPGGVRLVPDSDYSGVGRFQFTHPGRGATNGVDYRTSSLQFQFTHPGRGATTSLENSSNTRGEFQFTHPGRGATASASAKFFSTCVSIHAPREGCDNAW